VSGLPPSPGVEPGASTAPVPAASTAAPPVRPGRRLWLGAAAVAGLAGGVTAWRWAAPPRLDPAVEALWAQRFPRPEGGELVMAELRGSPVVLNFWATWCAPCVREMPELDRFQQRHAAAGWRVVGLAIDKREPVREFLTRVPVRFAIGLAGFGGSELGRSLGNAQGGLPFTVVLDRQGRVLSRKLGETTAAELENWLNKA
jgi:thiol-disulfide isomerase/thioredoxin